MSAFRRATTWGQTKPPPGTPVNWGHPLARGLVSAHLFNESSGQIVKNAAHPRYDGTAGSNTQFLRIPNGRSGLAMGCAPTGSNAITLRNGVVSGATYTIAMRIKVRSSGTNALIQNLVSTTGMFAADTGSSTAYLFNMNGAFSSTGIAYSTWVDVVFTVVAGAFTYYINGKSDGTGTGVTTLTFTGLANNTGDLSDCVFDYLYFFNRALRPYEARSLIAQPFSFMVAQTKRLARPASGAASHATSGVLIGQGSTIAGTSVHKTKHTTSGALTGAGSTIAGTSVHKTKHTTSGALTGPGSTVAGTSVHKTKHATSGALTGPGSAVSGTAKRFRAHPSAGALTGPGSSVAGTAKRFRSHGTSGTIAGPGAALAATATHSASTGTHATSGTLVGVGAVLAGIAARIAAPSVTTDSGVRRRRKPPPDEIEREQRMVREYLESLERQERAPTKSQAAKRRLPESVLLPAFTAAMAKAASDDQLQRIVEAAAADARAREIVQAEHRKRYWASFLTLALN